MRYQVGRLTDLRDDDPVVDTYEQAMSLIEKRDKDTFDEPPWGLWTDQDSGSELLAIYFQGGWYTE